MFFYLYLILDIYSRKIVAADISDRGWRLRRRASSAGASGRTRPDTGAAVAVRFTADTVSMGAAQRQRMQAVVGDHVDKEQLAAFGDTWQQRVRCPFLEYADGPETVQVTELEAGSHAA